MKAAQRRVHRVVWWVLLPGLVAIAAWGAWPS